ncbi:hypothetical protein [Ensifer sp. Root423]|nr:hypothetical protein [Ensifer sp. Root423]
MMGWFASDAVEDITEKKDELRPRVPATVPNPLVAPTAAVPTN